MPRTYEPIATTTLGSAQSSVTFNSISGAYTDLIIVMAGTNASDNNILAQFNSDTGSNYSYTFLYGTGSAVVSGRNSNMTDVLCGRLGTDQSVSIAQINSYSNSTTNKTIISRGNNSASIVLATVGLWRSTAAITTIKLSSASGNISSGTTFTLYGIKAA